MTITNPSLLSKIIERGVKSRLTDHLSSHNSSLVQGRAFYARGNEADCLINEPREDYSPSQTAIGYEW